MTPATFTATRRTLGLTQAKLAAHIGVSLSTVVKWEAGDAPVSPIAVRYMQALMATGWRPDDWPATAPLARHASLG